MKVVRRLTLPGIREFESSSWEIELSAEDISPPNDNPTIQDWLQVLAREAQARVLACMAADGRLSNEELSHRLKGFLGPTPKWLNSINELGPDGTFSDSRD